MVVVSSSIPILSWLSRDVHGEPNRQEHVIEVESQQDGILAVIQQFACGASLRWGKQRLPIVPGDNLGLALEVPKKPSHRLHGQNNRIVVAGDMQPGARNPVCSLTSKTACDDDVVLRFFLSEVFRLIKPCGLLCFPRFILRYDVQDACAWDTRLCTNMPTRRSTPWDLSVYGSRHPSVVRRNDHEMLFVRFFLDEGNDLCNWFDPNYHFQQELLDAETVVVVNERSRIAVDCVGSRTQGLFVAPETGCRAGGAEAVVVVHEPHDGSKVILISAVTFHDQFSAPAV